MSATPLTFVQEALYAAQGSWRVLIGRRDAPGYFETSMRGLVSSLIAMLVSIAVTLAIAALTRTGNGVSGFMLIVTNVVLYIALVASCWVVLRVLGKPDRFVPFLTVDNWLNAFISTGLAFAGLLGLGGDVVLFAAIIAGLAARINTARLIAGLKASEIVLLMVAQVVGVTIGLGVLSLLLPMPMPA